MKYLLFIALILLGYVVFAQKSPIVYGNVSEEELQMKSCSFYEGADAMVLGEVGNLHFYYDNDKGWQYVIDVVVRKKIFNNEGKEEGTQKIKLYDPIKGSSKEELITLKGVTYNLENGKIEKVKMSGSDKFETRIDDYRIEVGFAMPGIKNGSVIEYRYEIISDYVQNLRSWYFQSDIPVAYSQFEYLVPEFFNYQALILGTTLNLEEIKNGKSETFLMEWRTLRPAGGWDEHSKELTSNSISKKLIGKDIKPIEEEPFMANRVGVPSRIEFQLDYVQFPNEAVNQIAGDYSSFNTTLLKDESFGLRLNNGLFAKDWTASVEGKDELSKAKAIYSKAKNHFIWDENNGIFSSIAGKNAYTNKKGTVADINLSLVAALRDAGLKANPVILSTKSHGIPHPIYPSFNDFNYVVVAIIIDGKTYLCDATSNLPFNRLPNYCLNGKGWMVSEKGEWVNLKENNPYKSTSMIEISSENEKLISHYNIKDESYAAIELMQTTKKDSTQFKQDIVETFKDWQIKDFMLQKENSDDVFKYEFIAEKPIDQNDFIYLQPFLEGVYLENPFKREDRYSNIDFTYNYEKKAIAIIKIPEGYTYEAPESVNVKLLDGKMSFKYQVVQNNNNLNVVSDFKMNEVEYSNSEYQSLKNFFQLMVDKNNQLVILKKQ